MLAVRKINIPGSLWFPLRFHAYGLEDYRLMVISAILLVY